MRVIADLELCIGAGVCVLTAPGVFDQSADDGSVRLRVGTVSGTDAQLARQAVERCPAAALSIAAADDDDDEPEAA
jgi:ferredoxin